MSRLILFLFLPFLALSQMSPDAVYIGGSEVDKIYLNGTEVYTKTVANPELFTALTAGGNNEANVVGDLGDIRPIGGTTAVETTLVAIGTYALRHTSDDGSNDRLHITPTLADATTYNLVLYMAEDTGADIDVRTWTGATINSITPAQTTANGTLQEFTINFTTSSTNPTLRIYNDGTAGTDTIFDNISIKAE